MKLQNIQLIRFEPDHHTDLIYQWYYSGEYKEYFWNLPEMPTMADIAVSYQGKTLMIVDLTSNSIVGMVNSMVRSETARNFEIGLLVDKLSQGKGVGKKALKIALNYNFNTLNLYKYFAFVLDVNKPIQDFVNKFGCKHESTLKKHGFYNGEFHDLHVITMFKSDFNKMYKSDFEAPRLEAVPNISKHKARLEPKEASNHGIY